ncbi:MAG: sulfotransferase domain-containing protein [Rhodobacterales bacterium]|nr:sulfotransferase domain-containing protein [Rhodobacterales bacterium]
MTKLTLSSPLAGVRQRVRILPDFIIIGAMKAGTTTLYDHLAGHPDVGMSREKETDFFVAEKNWSRGLDWYQSQFEPGYACYGEASPNYTKAPTFDGVASRIKALVPDCRFIFICRDPVERAVSQYRHAVLSGQPIPAPEGLPGTADLDHLIETSAYGAQIAAYLAHFDLDRFLFLEFESLVSDPSRVLSDVAQFLGIRDDWPKLRKVAANSSDNIARLPLWVFRLRSNPAFARLTEALPRGARSRVKALLRRKQARTVAPIGPDLRDAIAAQLRDDIARFRDVTGMPFSHWSI